jgi:hypothetical protein
MSNCENFRIKILNRTGVEIRATKFEYTDPGGGTQTENIFVGGSDTIGPGETKDYMRNLQGIGNEFTVFTVTYQSRRGSGWGPNEVHEGNRFKCQDNEERLTIITGDEP